MGLVPARLHSEKLCLRAFFRDRPDPKPCSHCGQIFPQCGAPKKYRFVDSRWLTTTNKPQQWLINGRAIPEPRGWRTISHSFHSQLSHLGSMTLRGFRGASSNCIQPHLRDVAEALQGVKVRFPWKQNRTWACFYSDQLVMKCKNGKIFINHSPISPEY